MMCNRIKSQTQNVLAKERMGNLPTLNTIQHATYCCVEETKTTLKYKSCLVFRLQNLVYYDITEIIRNLCYCTEESNTAETKKLNKTIAQKYVNS